MNTILGLDVSNIWLDACLYNSSTKPAYERFSNDDKGHKALIDCLAQAPVKLIVCEPTGGYERAIKMEGNVYKPIIFVIFLIPKPFF